MKTIIKIIASLMLLATAILVTGCNSIPKSKNTNTEQTEPVAKTKYQCPMKCEGDKTYDESGKCPKCGMNLKELK